MKSGRRWSCAQAEFERDLSIDVEDEADRHEHFMEMVCGEKEFWHENNNEGEGAKRTMVAMIANGGTRTNIVGDAILACTKSQKENEALPLSSETGKVEDPKRGCKDTEEELVWTQPTQNELD